jgi:hypothetical protein
MNELELTRAMAPSLDALLRRGYDVEAVEDFERVEQLSPASGRARQSPMLGVSRNDFTQTAAFWVFLMREGRVSGGVGLKVIDLGDETFESYLRRTSRNQYGTGHDPIDRLAPPVRDEFRGRLIYIGELHRPDSERGDAFAVKHFIRIAQALAVMRWSSFDWMYAFVPQEHRKMAMECYQFTWQCPNAITWRDPAPWGRDNTHWIMAFPRAHYFNLMSIVARELAEQKPS